MSLPQIGAVTGPPGSHGVEKQNPLFPGGGQVTLQTSGRGSCGAHGLGKRGLRRWE